jgi:hypothetical protein
MLTVQNVLLRLLACSWPGLAFAALLLQGLQVEQTHKGVAK